MARGGDDQTLTMLSREIRGTVSEVAKLNGLYAPVRHDVDVNVRQSATAIIAEAERQLLAIEGEVVE